MLVETCIGDSPFIMRVNDMDDEFIRDMVETLVADDEPGMLCGCVTPTSLESIARCYHEMYMVGGEVCGKVVKFFSCEKKGAIQLQRVLKKHGFMVSSVTSADLLDVAIAKQRG